MSDLTNNLSQVSGGPKKARQTSGEYRFYLSMIFLTAVPFCAVIWTYQLFKHAKMPAQGPIQSALSEARTIAPCIFWA